MRSPDPPSHMYMELNVTTLPNAVCLAISGRIDQTSADDFEGKIKMFLEECQEGKLPLVMNLSKVDFISSVGLRVLVSGARKVQKQKGTLVFCELSPFVKEVFEIARLHLVFKVFDSQSAALANLG